MNEALDILFQDAVSTGYKGTKDDFSNLLKTNPEARKIVFDDAVSTGYNGTFDDFNSLIGLTVQPVAVQPDKKKVATALPSAASSSESVSTRPTEPTIATRKPQTTSFGTYGVSKPQPPTAPFKKPVAPEPESILGPVEKDMSVSREVSMRPTQPAMPKPAAPEPTSEANDYFTKSLDIIKSDFVGLAEGEVVPKLNYTFGQYGFKFNEAGPMVDQVEVVAPDGKTKETFSLDGFMFTDSDSTEAARLRKFISDNRPKSELLAAKEGQYTKPILEDKQIQETIMSLNADTDKLNKDFQEFKRLSSELEAKVSSVESMTPQQKEQFIQASNILEAKRLDIIRREQQIKSRDKSLEAEVGKYASMKGESGNAFTATRDALYGIIDDFYYGAMRGIGGLQTAVGLDNPATRVQSKALEVIPDYKDIVRKKFASESYKEYRESLPWLANAALGLVESVPAMIPVVGLPISIMQYTGQNYEDLDKADLTEGEKSVYATALAIPSAILAKMGFENAISEKLLGELLLKRALPRIGINFTLPQITNIIENDVKNLMVKGLLRIGVAGAAEFESGAIEEIIDIGGKKLINALEEKKIFKTPENFLEGLKQVAEAGAAEAVGGAIIGTVSAGAKGYQENKFENLLDDQVALLHQISSDPTFIDAYKVKIKQAVADGKITAEEGQSQEQSFDKMVGQLRSIPDGISPAGQKEALRLLKERDTLQAKIDASDPDLVAKEKARVAEIKEKLNKISEDYAVQESGTAEGVLRNEESQVGLQEMGEGNAEGQVAPQEAIVQEEVTAEPLDQKSNRLLDAIDTARQAGADGIDALNSALANLRGIASERVKQIGNRIDDLQQKVRDLTKSSTVPSATLSDLAGTQVNYNGESGTLNISEGGAVTFETPNQVIEIENATPTSMAADFKIEAPKPAIEITPTTDRFIDNDNVVINNVEYGIQADDNGNVVGLQLKDGSNQVLTNPQLLVKAETIRNTEGKVAITTETTITPEAQSQIDALNSQIDALTNERSRIEQATAEPVAAEATPTEKRFAGSVLAATRVVAEDLAKLVAILTKANRNVKVITDKQAMIDFLVSKGITPEQAAQVKGFRFGDKVYINPDLATVDTPIHEFAHIWGELCKKQRPELWKRGISLITKSNYYKNLLARIKANPELSKLYATPDAIKEEALIQAIGERGAVIFDDNKLQLLWNNWVAAFDNFVKKLLGLPMNTDITKIKLSEFLDMAATEVLTGKGTGIGGEMTIEKTKAAKNIEAQVGDWNNKLTTSFVSPIGKIFDMMPELSSIGTLEQYSRYLESIYPKSLVQGILFHSTVFADKFPAFEKFRRGLGIYFSSTSEYAKQLKNADGKRIVYALADIRKPFETNKPILDTPLEFYEGDGSKTFSPRELLNSKKYDSVVGIDAGQTDGNTIVVFNEDNVHILGSQKDLDGFKKYVNAPTKKNLFQSISGYLKSAKGTIQGAIQFQAQQSANDLAKIINDAIKAKLTKAQIVDILVKRGGLTAAEASQAYNDVKAGNAIAATPSPSAPATAAPEPKGTKFATRIADAIEKMSNGVFDNSVKQALIDNINAARTQIRQALTTEKALRKELIDILKQMRTSGKLSQTQALSLLRSFANTDIYSDASVNRFVNTVMSAMQNAEAKQEDSRLASAVKVASKNIMRKIGMSESLTPLLKAVFSIKPSAIPASVKAKYTALVDMMSQKGREIPLGEIGQVTDMANDVFDAIQDQFRVMSLKRVFRKFENKVFDSNNELDLDATINAMIDGNIISTEDADIIRNNADEFKAELKDETVDPQERIDLIDGVKSQARATNVDNLQNRMERDAARELIKMINEGGIEALTNNELANLSIILSNINNGIYTHYANTLSNAMSYYLSANGVKSLVFNTKPLAFSAAYANIVKLFTKSKSKIETMITQNPIEYLDQLLGNFGDPKVFKKLFNNVAKLYATYKSKYLGIDSRLNKAYDKVFKSHGFDIELMTESNMKMYAYLLQLEYMSNIGVKGVNPAAKYIDATIKQLRKDMKNAEAEILEKIKDEFVINDQVDIDKLYNSFNAAEKSAINEIREINNGNSDMALYTSAVITGDKSKTYANYIHHNVIDDSDNSREGGLANMMMNNTNPSTKAKSLISRTGGVRALNFDPFAATRKSSKQILIDYYLTDQVRRSRGTINALRNMAIEEGKFKGNTQEAIQALEEVLNKALENTFLNAYLETTLADDVSTFIQKTGYRAILGRIPRVIGEFLSNVSAIIMDPVAFVEGLKYSKILMSDKGPEIMKNLNANQQTRIYPSGGLSGSFVDTDAMMSRTGKRGISNKFLNKLSQLWNYTGKPLQNATETIADNMISGPDKIVARPMWFGKFATEFKKITGVDPDFDKIAANDEAYMTQYKEALENATDQADVTSTRLSAANNPFKGILKNAINPKQGMTKKLFIQFNSFMTQFLIYDFNAARTAVYALAGKGTISKTQATMLLSGIVLRMMTYQIIMNQMNSLIGNLFKDEDDEEENEKSFTDQLTQAAAGTLASFAFGRNFGNTTRTLVNYGVEKVNEKYFDFLREGEYDPYTDKLVYSPIQDGKINGLDDVAIALSGPLSPTLKTAKLAFRAFGKEKKEEDAIRRQELEKARVFLETGGNAGLVPFYGDIRAVFNSYIYKDLKNKIKSMGASEGVSREFLKRYFPAQYESLYGEQGSITQAEAPMKAAQKEIDSLIQKITDEAMGYVEPSEEEKKEKERQKRAENKAKKASGQ